MKKRSNSRTGLSSDAKKWLDGKPCGFFKFKSEDELIPLWETHGDESKMFWRRGVDLPITLESLESYKNAWLGSGEGSEYGGSAFFVFQYYDDAEKQTLWSERGDHESFYWKPGMLRPLAI